MSVQLPALKKSGAKISNWEVMEKVKEMARPFNFPVFKVSKSSLEFIRFEAEIENYSTMENVLAKLDMKTIKLSGFHEALKVRAAEAKPPFPTRHDWDSFFRENKTMNDMKAGERPDTIHFENLPSKWFVNYQDKSGQASDKPSEFVLKKAFATFGEVRIVDIPLLDPYRSKMKKSLSGISTFTFGQDLVFEAYIQYKEYIGFVKAMNALRGMKLLYKDRTEDRSWAANVKVDFDQSKHLADSTIKKRKVEREKIIQKERDKEKQELREKEMQEIKGLEEYRKMEAEEKEKTQKKKAKELVAFQRRMAREDKRKKKKLAKQFLTEEEEMAERIAMEERKLLIAQRKLESIRILDELLERVKVVKSTKDDIRSLEKEIRSSKSRKESQRSKRGDSPNLKDTEKDMRDKLVMKLKKNAEESIEQQQRKISKAKTTGFESDSDARSLKDLENLEGISDDEMEEISDDEIENEEESDGEVEDMSDVDSVDDDLRLTSTDDDEDKEYDSEEEERRRKKKKKEKKIKLKKEKKDKKKKKEKERDDSRERRKKKDKEKELNKQIGLAQRIASRKSPPRREKKVDLWEHEKYDRERPGSGSTWSRPETMRNSREDRSRSPTGYFGAADYYERRKRESPTNDEEFLDDRERDERGKKNFLRAARMSKVNKFLSQSGMRKEHVEKEMERAYNKYFSSLAKKEMGPGSKGSWIPGMAKPADIEKEEQWERMTNPHLFGGGGGGYRKVKVGEHYEEVQKEVLQHEIRIRERREKMDNLEKHRRSGDRDNYDRGGRERYDRGGPDRYDRGGPRVDRGERRGYR